MLIAPLLPQKLMPSGEGPWVAKSRVPVFILQGWLAVGCTAGGQRD
jgi:hypothetical protein